MRRPASLMLGAMQIIPVCMVAGLSDLACAAARNGGYSSGHLHVPFTFGDGVGPYPGRR